ncbi:MAG: neutral zinc metallopeptidase [Myxococcota bacterium]
MRWQGGRKSDNIEDRRGGGRGVRRVAVPAGGGCVVVVLVVGVGLLFGASPGEILQALSQVEGQQPAGRAPAPRAPSTRDPNAPDVAGDFVSVVLADTEDVWTQEFAKRGAQYRPPKLVLFSGTVSSACGRATAASGPFYCPGDLQVYLDTSFFAELDQQFGAPGDFAAAYVIAHEVGHHIQRLTGVAEQVDRLQARSGKTQSNALSVLQELQADCYAGVWAHHAHKQRQLLEQGDVEEGLRAAAAIGDDRLQRMSRGTVVPESFTHGSSAQRVEWFKRGLQGGSIEQCDTFARR